MAKGVARVATVLAAVPFSSEFSAGDLAGLSLMMENGEYMSMGTIIEKGTTLAGDELQFYVILSGVAETPSNNGKTWEELGEGKSVEETALFSDEVATYECRAKNPVEVVRMSKRTFQTPSKGHQQ